MTPQRKQLIVTLSVALLGSVSQYAFAGAGGGGPRGGAVRTYYGADLTAAQAYRNSLAKQKESKRLLNHGGYSVSAQAQEVGPVDLMEILKRCPQDDSGEEPVGIGFPGTAPFYEQLNAHKLNCPYYAARGIIFVFASQAKSFNVRAQGKGAVEDTYLHLFLYPLATRHGVPVSGGIDTDTNPNGGPNHDTGGSVLVSQPPLGHPAPPANPLPPSNPTVGGGRL